MYRSAFRTSAVLAAAILVAVSASLTPASSQVCQSGMEPWEGYWLYFGRNQDGREVVSDLAWEEFLVDTVSTTLPDGYTVFDARGQWRNSAGNTERERTKVLNVVFPPDADGWNRVQNIASAYQQRFGQEIVLKVSENVCVAF